MIQYKSINHQNTSLTDREDYYKQLDCDAVGPSVLLQTCNRVELYYGDGDVPDAVARHLFRVVCGLESAIVGERAIQGQVKEAYMIAKDSGQKLSAGLHKLFECALQIGKRVRTETQISQGAVSHSLAAIEVIEKENVNLKDAHIAIIGVNKLTEDIIKFLKNKGAELMFLANRTEEKAHKLADPYGIEVYRLDEKRDFLRTADILISATSSPHAIVFKEDLNASRPLLAIDLAFPRDIDPEVTEIEGVKLYNLQDIENVVQSNIAVRHEEMQKAEKKGYNYNPKEDTGDVFANVKRHLTKYSVDTAQEQFKVWKELETTMLIKFIDGNVKAQNADGTFKHSDLSVHIPEGLTQPGYTDLWKQGVATSYGEVLEVVPVEQEAE